MDLASLQNELDRLEELHNQGWVIETEYIRRKEELIASIQLAELDGSSDDENSEENQILSEPNEEPAALNLEDHKNEPITTNNDENNYDNNYEELSSTNKPDSVVAKSNPAKPEPAVTQKKDLNEEDEEVDPYDMDTKYDPVEEERKKREKKSGVKEYATYKEYLENNPSQEHLREDAQSERPSSITTGTSAAPVPAARGRGGRVMVRAPRGKPSVLKELETPVAAPEPKQQPVNRTPKSAPKKQPVKNMYSYLDEETLEKKTEDTTTSEPKVEDFNATNRPSIFATEDLVVQHNATTFEDASETQQSKPKAEKDKPVVYISDRESDDSAFYDTIKGPDTPTQEIQAVWEKLQLEYASKLVLKNKEEWVVSRKSPLCNIKYVGGFDISFPKGNKVDACVCLAVVRHSDQRVVFAAYKMIKLKLPYIPGLLNFREVPHYITLLNEVKNHPDYKQYVPDIIMVDGNGILHTRGCGAACQLGYLADIPCLGVAKKLLTVDGVTLKQIDQQFAKEGGKFAKIVGASGKLHGMAFKATPRDDVLFVSCGHLIDMETTAALVEQCTLIGSPEPVKQADLLSRQYIKDNFQIKEQP